MNEFLSQLEQYCEESEEAGLGTLSTELVRYYIAKFRASISDAEARHVGKLLQREPTDEMLAAAPTNPTGLTESAASVSAPAQQAEASLDQNELYRLQMAAISTAAFGYWKLGDPIKDEYVTVALKDVASLYEKYDALFKAAAAPAPSVEAQADELMRACLPILDAAAGYQEVGQAAGDMARRFRAALKESQQ